MTSLTAAQLAAIKTCWADLQAFWETCDCVPTFRFAMVRGWEAGFAFQAARLAEAEATIARQQTFIKDIEWLGHSFDAGQPYLHCLICQGIKGVTGHTPLCPIPTLLAPPTPEADDAT